MHRRNLDLGQRSMAAVRRAKFLEVGDVASQRQSTVGQLAQRVGKNTRAWTEKEIEDWIATRPKAGDGKKMAEGPMGSNFDRRGATVRPR